MCCSCECMFVLISIELFLDGFVMIRPRLHERIKALKWRSYGGFEWENPRTHWWIFLDLWLLPMEPGLSWVDAVSISVPRGVISNVSDRWHVGVIFELGRYMKCSKNKHSSLVVVPLVVGCSFKQFCFPSLPGRLFHAYLKKRLRTAPPNQIHIINPHRYLLFNLHLHDFSVVPMTSWIVPQWSSVILRRNGAQRRYRGRIRSFSEAKGFGFIDCPESGPLGHWAIGRSSHGHF